MRYKLMLLKDVRDRVGYVYVYVYNEGPPHDHNFDWVDSRYLEDLHPDTFKGMGDDVEIRVLIEDTGEFMEFRGRFIIDSYFLLSEKSQAK